ncbi:hypothetical protein [Kitasatospora purpeofusca]|uniref:hypothetical protein n=1 Tax=Kitasatospora purpeofusca TaxID=67352 RepID=UPI002A5A39C9|nr:hypothetical protein [Kitasatospora purpeofusca]MDY0814824.1 hypothetical protein [Kitasatospora purpeofusca]
MKTLYRCLAVGVVALGGLTAVGAAPVPAATGAGAPSADDTPPPAVEDFTYPQADRIFQERGIRLKSGDGRILLVTCDSRPGLLEVNARGMTATDPVGRGRFCFQVSGSTGRLSLELPSVYAAKGNDYAVRLDMRTGTEAKSFDVEKNKWTQVGETADPQERVFTLLEITATA